MNLGISVFLAATTYTVVRTLKRHFAQTFRREIASIRTILLIFTVCYIGRCGYEIYENIRNARQLKEEIVPSQFWVDMESMLIFLVFVDSPIFLVLLLHHRNATQVASSKQVKDERAAS